jgi:NADH:ubiquinone reductase (H+-translocating)
MPRGIDIDTVNKRKQIIILGGGFGGMYAALHLEKQLARNPDVDILLVNRENFFLFTPMLHEVASCELDITHIVNPIRKLLKRTTFFAGEVESIDVNARTVTVSHGSDDHTHDFTFDHLVVALGSVTNFFGMKDLEENAITMKSLGDAIHLRNQIIKNLEEADGECSAVHREVMLSFMVAGGGFAGVETMAAINDFVRDAIKHYPNLNESQIKMTLVHPGDVILPELGPHLGSYTQKILSQRKVDVRTKAKVTSYRNGEAVLSDGQRIPTNLLVWTAGTTPNPLLSKLPCAKERGRLVANDFLEVPQWPGIWTLGDCAHLIDPGTGKPYPPTAQHAIRQGKVLAANIAATLNGQTKKAFRFNTIGLLASTGKKTGVAEIFGLKFSGRLAWWMWRTIYLSKLPGLEKKVRVALDWTLDLLFSKDLVQFLTLKSKSVSHPEDFHEVSTLDPIPATLGS